MPEHNHEHDEVDDEDEPTLLEGVIAEIGQVNAKVIGLKVVASAKNALTEFALPLVRDLAEATQDFEERLRGELFGDPDDEDDDGMIGDLEAEVERLEGRIAGLERNGALMAVGMQMRERMTALARSVKTYAADKPNVVAEAD